MDSRQQFEEWSSDNGKWPQAVERNGDSYKIIKTHTDWLAWQASRAEIVIDMPRSFSEDRHFRDVYEAEDVLEAIHAAGIRTK